MVAGRKGFAAGRPAALFHATDRNGQGLAGRGQYRQVDDPVLFAADQFLTVEQKNRLNAIVLEQQMRHAASLGDFPDPHLSRPDGRVQQSVSGSRIAVLDQGEHGQVVRVLDRTDFQVFKQLSQVFHDGTPLSGRITVLTVYDTTDSIATFRQFFALLRNICLNIPMETPFYTLPELLEKANALRARIPELADTPAFTERTVYYYVQQRLLPRRAGQRGPGTRYPEDFLYRLLFIRRLQKEKALSLAHIREILQRVSPDTVRAVALGEEPLEIVDTTNMEPAELDATLSRHRDAVWLDRPMVVSRQALKNRAKEAGEQTEPDMDSPFMDMAFEPPKRFEMKPAHTEEREFRTPVFTDRSVGLGPGVQLVLDHSPSPRQVRLLRNLAPLVQAILKDRDEGTNDEEEES